jgi:RNA binding exosome subunit
VSRLQVQLHTAKLSTFAHATEDPEKVKQALFNLLPPSLRDTITIQSDNLKGHFKNPIVIFSVKLSKKRLIEEFVTYLSQTLPEQDKAQLTMEFDQRFAVKNVFYIRFSKQDAYKGRLTVKHIGDDIQLELKIKGHKISSSDVYKFLTEKGILVG